MLSEKEKEIAREAYLLFHKKLNLKPGDIVKVVNRAADYVGGWDNEWFSYKDLYVGKEAEVLKNTSPPGHGIRLKIQDVPVGHFPVFVLEVVSRKADESTINKVDQKAVMLLTQAIDEKWIPIHNKTMVDKGSENCVLCHEYNNCEECPINQYTNFNDCEPTPFTPWTNHQRKIHLRSNIKANRIKRVHEGCEECEKLCNQEITFLAVVRDWVTNGKKFKLRM